MIQERNASQGGPSQGKTSTKGSVKPGTKGSEVLKGKNPEGGFKKSKRGDKKQGHRRPGGEKWGD